MILIFSGFLILKISELNYKLSTSAWQYWRQLTEFVPVWGYFHGKTEVRDIQASVSI